MIKHVELMNQQNKVLRGYLDMPESFNGEMVVMFHGFTGNKSEHAYHFRNFSRILSGHHFASLRLDFSGNGESDGEFRDFTMDTLIEEAKIIVQYALNYPKVSKTTLLGFSMGGAVCSILAPLYHDRVSKIMLWSPAANIASIIQKYYLNGVKLENGNALHGIFEISKQMYESTNHYDPFFGVEKFENKVLLIHGKKDLVVGYQYSLQYADFFKNSELHLIESAGHGYDQIVERDKLYEISLSFLKNNK